MKGQKYKQGFTLLELLIVMAIVSTVASLSWETLVKVRNQSQVNNACESVATMVNKARSYALSGINDTSEIKFECSKNLRVCDIRRRKDAGSGWSLVSGESQYPVESGVTTTDFTVIYSLPYASNAIITHTATIASESDPSISKNISIDSFKAVCQ